MKKTYTLLLLAFVAIGLQAQNNKSTKFSWGYKIGLNVSNLRVENGDNTSWKTGLATGLFFHIKLNDKWGVQPEALYSSMGATNVVNGDGSLRLNYFSLPVMATYKICKTATITAGPQADVLIQAKTKNELNTFAKVTNDYKETSIALTAGAQWWPMRCLGVSLRYIYGFSNVSEATGNEIKNQGVQLMAAVKL